MNLHRCQSASGAAEACAAFILDRLNAAIASQSSATLAISGGSSPRVMFEIFGRTPFAWDKVHLFWVDERMVPPTDAKSNYKLAFDTWLGPGKFPPSNIHRVVTELHPNAAAVRYQEEIQQHFHLSPSAMPRFDVIHRGMGPDGHTASLFPGEPLIADRARVAAALWAPKMNQWRVTLLPGVLEAARHTAMLVTGEDKSAMLSQVLAGAYSPSVYPAQIVALDAATHWFLDEPAAADLPLA